MTFGTELRVREIKPYEPSDAFGGGFSLTEDKKESSQNNSTDTSKSSASSATSPTVSNIASMAAKIGGVSDELERLMEGTIGGQIREPWEELVRSKRAIDELISKSEMPADPNKIKQEHDEISANVMEAVNQRTTALYLMLSGEGGEQAYNEANKKVEDLSYLSSEIKNNPERYYAMKQLGAYEKVATYYQGLGYAIGNAKPELSNWANMFASLMIGRMNILSSQVQGTGAASTNLIGTREDIASRQEQAREGIYATLLQGILTNKDLTDAQKEKNIELLDKQYPDRSGTGTKRTNTELGK